MDKNIMENNIMDNNIMDNNDIFTSSREQDSFEEANHEMTHLDLDDGNALHHNPSQKTKNTKSKMTIDNSNNPSMSLAERKMVKTEDREYTINILGEKEPKPLAEVFPTDHINDVAQNEHGIRVVMDRSRDQLLTNFGKVTLEDRYLLPNESYQDMYARVAMHYADNTAHAQRIYDYISQLWFMPATPILSNGGTTRGLPISCFLNEADDSLRGIVDLWQENVWLAAKGGGIGSYWGNLRSLGETVKRNGKTSGVIPFIRVMDSLTLAISQGSLRRGSSAVYLPIDHPEILEFLDIRRPSGGDPNRKALNINHGVVISDEFMRAVEHDLDWKLVSPHDGHVVDVKSARDIWIRMLTARLETGEPYMLFIDHVNRALPEQQLQAGLRVKTSNLCSEITLPTGLDKWGGHRTAVCCLSSVNLEYFPIWSKEKHFIEDILRFLDNVLQDFIDNAPDDFSRASYAAMRERSVGLGVMGFHSFLQSKNIPIESLPARSWNTKMFKFMRTEADKASQKLAVEKGPCPDAAEAGIMERFSNKLAVAPTASISIICGGASPGIEPNRANSYSHKTLSGTFTVQNKHLRLLLEAYGKNDQDTWSSISMREGSVQHLDFLSDEEKEVFKTAFEINQESLIDLAAVRTPYICQAQSFNLFIQPNIHKKDLHNLHMRAWKKGLKSLYYCRSRSLQRAESGGTSDGKLNFMSPLSPNYNAELKHELDMAKPEVAVATTSSKYDECETCQ